MRQFDIKRFWHTFRWYFSENRGRLLTYTISMAMIALVLESFFSWIGHKSVNMNMEMEMVPAYIIMTRTGFGMSLFSALIGCFLSFSGIFSTLKTKQKRIAYLTLPATNLERYLVAFIMAVIIIPICIFVGLAVGDTIRMLIFAILGSGWFSCIKSASDLFFSGFGTFTKNGFLKETLEQSTNIWLCSLYVLGGTWFRRRSFLIVTAFLILLFTVCMYVLSLFFGNIELFMKGQNSIILGVNDLAYPTIFALIALSIFNFWLSYKIFKRFQIITSKWTNV